MVQSRLHPARRVADAAPEDLRAFLADHFLGFHREHLLGRPVNADDHAIRVVNQQSIRELIEDLPQKVRLTPFIGRGWHSSAAMAQFGFQIL